jgi:hypothetical protein
LDYALKTWYREKRHDLLAGYVRQPVYSQAHKKRAVEHGRCIAATIKSPGRSLKGHCCLRGSKNCLRRSVRASRIDPRPQSGYKTAALPPASTRNIVPAIREAPI